jgi:hypothetical protein
MLFNRAIEQCYRCNANGTLYEDGASIDSADACEHCYCMKGEIVCALEQCMSPGKAFNLDIVVYILREPG